MAQPPPLSDAHVQILFQRSELLRERSRLLCIELDRLTSSLNDLLRQSHAITVGDDERELIRRSSAAQCLTRQT